MAEFPALPLFTDAYLADTEHLSDNENGIYIRLLMIIWRSPNCKIPNDNDWLARRFRKTVDEVKIKIRPIITEFCQCDGNWITQKRLQKEWNWCRHKRVQSSVAAKSMWEKKKHMSNGNTEPQSVGNAAEYASRNAPFPSLPFPSVKGLSEEESKEVSEGEV